MLAEWLLSVFTAAHTVGLLAILVWTDSLVPGTESKGDLHIVCHTEQTLWCWDKLREQDKLSRGCDCSRARGRDKVSEEQAEKQSEEELSKALWYRVRR